MLFTDSHCHLAMIPPQKAEEVLERARGEGVHGFLVPATHLADAPAAVQLSAQHGDVWSAVGFHPHEAKECDDAAFGEIARLSGSERVVAIGEVGLDYHYDHSPRSTQREVLVRHIALAKERDLPVIVHNRESTGDLLALLRSSEAKGVRGVLHSFTESWETARDLLDLGFFISFSGILTFKSAESLRDTARRIPMDRTLIETDSPYLAPVPHRGKDNEPAFVLRTAESLAALWSTDLEQVAEATTTNFESLFRVKIPR